MLMNKLRYIFLLFCFLATNALAADKIFQQDGSAIRGYDAVSYHTLKQPVKGDTQFAFEWKGVNWLFSSQQNRDLFSNNPDKYAPKYGGHCAYAASKGYIAPIDPQAWTVVDDQLYLNYSISVRSLWQKDIPGNIKKADANWPELSAQ